MKFDLEAISRSDFNRATQAADGDDSELAERLVEAIVDGRHDTDTADWYDVVVDRTGTKYEVKSTSTRIGEDYPADGRFRVWQGQIRSLINSRHAGDDGTAWVAFVLFDEDGNPVRVRRLHPETVLRIVHDRGGWNTSGHEEMGRQHKLPIEAVFDR